MGSDAGGIDPHLRAYMDDMFAAQLIARFVFASIVLSSHRRAHVSVCCFFFRFGFESVFFTDHVILYTAGAVRSHHLAGTSGFHTRRCRDPVAGS
jgi:hypothetical protein